ncbi:MAG: tRNA (cytidine(34)-2'-O)-methyltransferase [Phycisphaerales bacterium]|nr:tRNA (cytidine(34)-2'-O)-methyltransferase [Phycisphaerales bacterium]
MTDPLFNIVLWQPQIPQNTGNIGRTAMATHCRLHVIHPIGFDMSEKARRRAGLDYWDHVDCREHSSFDAYLQAESPRRLWLFTTKSTRPHWNANYQSGDHLLFGQEQGGVSAEIHEWVSKTFGPDHRITFPMVAAASARSLNLATAVACGVYEGLRQVSLATGTMPPAYDS